MDEALEPFRMALELASENEPAELQRIGCSLASSALDFIDCLKPRLSKFGKYNDSLDALAELLVEKWGVFTVAQLRAKSSYEAWEQSLLQAGLPTAWVDTFGRSLGLELAPATKEGRPGGTPSSASLATFKLPQWTSPLRTPLLVTDVRDPVTDVRDP